MKKIMTFGLVASTCAMALYGCNSGGGSAVETTPKNIVFFLGDGMGIVPLTAARIYAVGEDGDLTIDTFPESAFVRTYSNDAMVTDSAPSMAAYMTGVKMNNEVVSMSSDTKAYATNDPTTKYVTSNGDSTCPSSGNGSAVTTILELAKAAGLSVGAVTTTRVTHATPAVTYSHICHRDGENAIAAQLVKNTGLTGASSYNTALADGIDVLLGGGRRHFTPSGTTGTKRSDTTDLVQKLKDNGYAVVQNATEMRTAQTSATSKLIGLFTQSHMTYELDRNDATEPSLTEMTQKALDVLSKNKKGFFLMVEGGRIDHALHESSAQYAVAETVAFDTAIKDTMARLEQIDPGLKNTIVVVTADHDHTLLMNGYAKRVGKTNTTGGYAGILGFVKNVISGSNESDANSNPYTILGFGNGENAVATRGTVGTTRTPDGSNTANDPSALTLDSQLLAKNYHQEATIPRGAGDETHGGADVFLGAKGKGAELFTGVITNTNVFGLLRNAIGL